MATGRNGTILVIDDEEIMRDILETLLTREGYDAAWRLQAKKGSTSRARCHSTRRSSTS